jgi:hypothetical protein
VRWLGIINPRRVNMNRFTKIVAAALLGLAIANAHAEVIPGSEAYDVEKVIRLAEKYTGLSAQGKVPNVYIATTPEDWQGLTGILSPETAANVLGHYESDHVNRTINLRLDVTRSRLGVSVILHEAVHFLQDVNGQLPINPTQCQRSAAEKVAHQAEIAYLKDSGLNATARVATIEKVIETYQQRCDAE